MRCNVLKVVGLLNIVAAAVARGEVGAGAVPSSDQQYYQYLSLRYHTAANPSPPPPLQSPPWETLAVLAAGIKQLIPFPNPQEGVWALTADYTLYAVTVPPQQNQPRHSDGASTPTPTPTTSATSVELVNISISHGAVLTAAAAGEVGTPTTEMTLAVATPNAVTWYSVAKGAAVVKGHVLLTPTPLQTQMPTANLKSKPKNAISTVNAAACAPGLASSASVRTDRRLREAVGPRKGQPILPCHTVFVASDVGLFQASMGGGAMLVSMAGQAPINVTSVVARVRPACIRTCPSLRIAGRSCRLFLRLLLLVLFFAIISYIIYSTIWGRRCA